MLQVLPPLVGILTADEAEVSQGSIFQLLDSVDLHVMRCLLVLRDGSDQTAERLAGHPAILDIVRIQPAGLSCARNRGLQRLAEFEPADDLLVCFPDDDGWYPEGLAREVLALATGQDLVLGGYGQDGELVEPLEAAPLGLATAYRRANSVGIYVRWGMIRRVDGFDENLGVGCQRIQAGEDLDFVIAVLLAGAKAVFCSGLQVQHPISVTVRPERVGAHLVVARRYWRNPTSARVLLRGVLASLAGRSYVPRQRLIRCLLPMSRAGAKL